MCINWRFDNDTPVHPSNVLTDQDELRLQSCAFLWSSPAPQSDPASPPRFHPPAFRVALPPRGPTPTLTGPQVMVRQVRFCYVFHPRSHPPSNKLRIFHLGWRRWWRGRHGYKLITGQIRPTLTTSPTRSLSLLPRPHP